MKKSTKYLIFAGSTLFSIIFIVVFAISLKNAQGEDLTKLLGVKQKLSAPVAMDAIVKDETGTTHQFKDFLSGRPIVLMPVFYSCQSACTTEFEGALKTFRAMKKKNIGEDYDVVTLSIHPHETTELAAAKKKDYTDFYNRPGTEKSWHFLTGDYAEVQKICQSVGFEYTYDAKKDRVIHPTALIILTPQGKVSKYFMGTDYPSTYFQDSIVAAANNQIGTVAEPVAVGCFMIDPSTGKTFVSVSRAMQLLGSITVLALLASIVAMVKKDKKSLDEEPKQPNDSHA